MVHDRLDGSYYVEYNATVPGRYMLSISILDQSIAGAPSPWASGTDLGYSRPQFLSDRSAYLGRFSVSH
jgi:hypothetical protein